MGSVAFRGTPGAAGPEDCALPQRGFVSQPRVAAQRLPWGPCRALPVPRRGSVGSGVQAFADGGHRAGSAGSFGGSGVFSGSWCVSRTLRPPPSPRRRSAAAVGNVTRNAVCGKRCALWLTVRKRHRRPRAGGAVIGNYKRGLHNSFRFLWLPPGPPGRAAATKNRTFPARHVGRARTTRG